MKPFKYLAHPADLRMQIIGKDQSELFSNAMLAVFDAMKPEKTNEAVSKIFEIDAPDPEDLLIDFLNEIITLSQTEYEAYESCEFTKITPHRVSGILNGVKIKKFELEIKAATYHGLEIKETKNGLVAEIVFDI